MSDDETKREQEIGDASSIVAYGLRRLYEAYDGDLIMVGERVFRPEGTTQYDDQRPDPKEPCYCRMCGWQGRPEQMLSEDMVVPQVLPESCLSAFPLYDDGSTGEQIAEVEAGPGQDVEDVFREMARQIKKAARTWDDDEVRTGLDLTLIWKRGG